MVRTLVPQKGSTHKAWLLDSERVKRQALVTQYELIGYQGAADSRAMAAISSASGRRGN